MPVPLTSPPTDRRLLRDDVYGRLRDAIIDGTFEPGEQLRDAELATWLGVSRTPVREALLRLGQTGLVVARPGRSTTVSTISERAVREARDVVAAMHELAVREAVPSLTADDVERMREANDRFEQAVTAGDVEAALAADDELHGVPVTVCGNRSLATVLEQFTPVLRRAERLRFASLDGRDSVARHAELIRLCAAGDVDGASAVAFGTFHELTPSPPPPSPLENP
ncbi:GntR family transcriptional regulator [Nocardioides sp. Root122]|uniref:GntR family transcriptional regulator n=1 Tax=Nocardioides TaxID=1839 RepID=UPI000702E033|nr:MULTISPECIES: GntR family transcriptional regulator [Nocardioides]KQV71284.1 GntR family transcriptional regulator [Nocardioides sp. Root122]MCK9822764.1 GntR family transcriptional regulator [Nocardioides cavernae]